MSTPTIDIKKLSKAERAKLNKELKEEARREKAQSAAKRDAYDALRDKYIETVFGKMDELSAVLRDFKEESVKLGLELHDKMYEAYDREKRDGIDHYSLVSADGLKKVTIERQWRCEYDESAEVAIAQMKEVLRDKFAGRNKGMYDMLESVLLKNNKGDYDEKLVAKLRKHKDTVNDARFTEALDILANSYKPSSSQTYIRAYRRDTDKGKWVDLTMNWSSM